MSACTRGDGATHQCGLARPGLSDLVHLDVSVGEIDASAMPATGSGAEIAV
jgi:hypothetical protein